MNKKAGNMIKTSYPGVYYRITKRIGKEGREKVFYYTFKENGKKIWAKAGRQFSDDMTAARAATKRGKRIAGEIDTPQEKRKAEVDRKKRDSEKWTIDRLWTEYELQKEDNKSFRTDKGRYILYLKETFGDKEPKEIIQLEIDRLRVGLLKKKSPQTCKHILALLKRVIKFGSDRGLCAPLGFAIKLPRVDNKKTEFLTPEEVERLLEAIRNDKHPQAGNIMLVALYTGMRRSEILGLQWRDVDFQNGFINIAVSKGGRAQKIPLNDGARQVFESIEKGKGGYVFPGNLGDKRSNINRAINVIKTAAGLPDDFRPLHGLRHHFASMLASSGAVDLYTLQKLLTHKDHRMTERYAHLHDDTLKRASGVASDIIGQAMQDKAKKRAIK
jgi:integrase